MEEQTQRNRKKIIYFSSFCYFDARIDLLHNSLICLPLSSPPLWFSLSPASQPLLQKMACTLGLFSNYSSTFSEKVIIIRDPFSFSVKKHEIFFFWLWSLEEEEEKKNCCSADLKWLYYYGWVDRLHALMVSLGGETGLLHITSAWMEKDILENSSPNQYQTCMCLCVHLSKRIMSRGGHWKWKLLWTITCQKKWILHM